MEPSPNLIEKQDETFLVEKILTLKFDSTWF